LYPGCFRHPWVFFFMVIFLQYTVTDLRVLGPRKDELLNTPSWPNPIPFQEFVHGSGLIVARTRRGLSNWIGENLICKIRSGIRVPGPIRLTEPANNILKNTGKHLYVAEGRILNKYELVFVSKRGFGTVTKELLKQLIFEMQKIPLRIRGIGFEHVSSQVGKLAKPLKDFHIVSTTFKKHASTPGHQDLILLCTPQIYIVLDESETIQLPQHQRLNEEDPKQPYQLYTSLDRFGSQVYRTWIYKGSPGDEVSKRELRISLMRLHSEYECLRNVLRAISKGKVDVKPFSPDSNALQDYFTKAINTFLDSELEVKSQTGNKELISIVYNLFDHLQPGEVEQLRGQIDRFDFRRQTKNKTINFIENYYENVETMNDKSIFITGNNNQANTGDSSSQNQQSNCYLPPDLDYDKLQKELEALKKEMQSRASTPVEFEALASVAAAEGEAKVKQGSKVVEYLRKGGQWVLDVGTKIGVSVVTELVKKNMGL
jgi:hypothetical protein